MNLKKQGIYLCLLITLASPIYGKDASQPVVGNYELLGVKELVDSGWLPDITGLPNEEQVESLTRHVADVMAEEQDKKCNAIDYNLRMVVFKTL